MILDDKEKRERWETFREKAKHKAEREKAKHVFADNPMKLCVILFAIDERCKTMGKFKTASLKPYCGMSSQEIGHYMPVLVDKGFLSVFTHASPNTYQKDFRGEELERLIEERVG